MRSAPSESWSVWFSEEWTHTLVDLKFLDTVSGNVLAALRNNRGGPASQGHPDEQFVTIHPRAIQQRTFDGSGNLLFSAMYGTSQDRLDRLTLFRMGEGGGGSNTAGLDPAAFQILAVTDMFVLPTGKGDGRQPWILLSVVVAPSGGGEKPPDVPTTQDEFDSASSSYSSTNSFYETSRRDICINLNLDIFVTFAGMLCSIILLAPLRLAAHRRCNDRWCNHGVHRPFHQRNAPLDLQLLLPGDLKGQHRRDCAVHNVSGLHQERHDLLNVLMAMQPMTREDSETKAALSPAAVL